MYLSGVLVRNFRGIRSLEVNFEKDNTVLIGENSWGKSSLLRALWLALGQGEILCSLKAEDMYIPIDLDSNTAQTQNNGISRRCTLIDSLIEHENDERKTADAALAAATDAVMDTDSDIFTNQAQSEYEKTQREGENSDCPKDIHEQIKDDQSFKSNDIYNEDISEIEIRLYFKETGYGQMVNSSRLQRLNPYWYMLDDGIYSICWQIKGYVQNSVFITEHSFLDASESVINSENKETAIKTLIHMNPVLRVRDSRVQLSGSASDEDSEITKKEHQTFEDYIGTVSRGLSDIAANDDFTAIQARQGLETLDFISSKYLVPYNHTSSFRKDRNSSKSIRDMVNTPVTIESLNSIRETLNSKDLNKEKILAFYLASALFLSKGNREIDKKAKPILILEDIEARFHPSILLSFWSVVATIPIQKIITTNSGDLLSAIPLGDIRRLCRQHYDTRSYAVREKSFSADDLRRIAFHIRLNRPTTLFARCWVLVEGETEIWILNQIASILGISMQCIGIRPIEFAQCGLHPLIKLARQLGINFYVLTDGDEAGHKYAQTVIGSVGAYKAKMHMTVLPRKDIEHFLFSNGFDYIFCRCAGLERRAIKCMSADKIIDIAIKKKTKPGLALEVMEAMAQSGASSVPRLFVKMFRNILDLAKSDSIIN